jgi:hypothetical protein
MINLKTKAKKKVKKYEKELMKIIFFKKDLSIFYGKKYNDSFLSVIIDYKISLLEFKKTILEKIFKI